MSKQKQVYYVLPEMKDALTRRYQELGMSGYEFRERSTLNRGMAHEQFFCHGCGSLGPWQISFLETGYVSTQEIVDTENAPILKMLVNVRTRVRVAPDGGLHFQFLTPKQTFSLWDFYKEIYHIDDPAIWELLSCARCGNERVDLYEDMSNWYWDMVDYIGNLHFVTGGNYDYSADQMPEFDEYDLIQSCLGCPRHEEEWQEVVDISLGKIPPAQQYEDGIDITVPGGACDECPRDQDFALFLVSPQDVLNYKNGVVSPQEMERKGQINCLREDKS